MTGTNGLFRALPQALEPFAEGESLRFRSQGPHRYVWFAGLVAASMWFCATIGAFGLFGAARDGFVVFGTLLSITIASIASWSIAYSIWGSIELRRESDAWIVRTQLWRWRHERRFPFVRIKHVELSNPDPIMMARPGVSGDQLTIYLRHPDREVMLFGGVCLDRVVLAALIELLEPPLLPATMRDR